MYEHNEFDRDGLEGPAMVPALAGPDMTDLAEQLVTAAASRGLDLTGENGLLTALTKQVLQSALEVECGDPRRLELLAGGGFIGITVCTPIVR